MSGRAAGTLDGVRVLELSHAIAGPHAAQMLADHGADVIKIEPPAGDMSRQALPLLDGDSVYFASHNRGKRSVVLDLKSAEGVRALHDLCRTADVVLTNYGPGVPQRLGWSFEVLSVLNPRLVMVHITGFGAGRDANARGAYDGVIQAMSGIADLTGPADGGPTFVGAFVADHVAAYHAVVGTLLALRERDASGRGAFLDIAMLDSYSAMLAHEVGIAESGTSPGRSGNQVQTAFANVFASRDGAVFVAPLGESAWVRFWRAIDRPDMGLQVTYDASTGARREELEAIISAWTAARDTATIVQVLDDFQVPVGPVRTAAQSVASMADRDMVLQVEAPGAREFRVPGRPVRFGLTDDPRGLVVPELGAHTTEVLEGLLEQDVSGLNADRASHLEGQA